MAESDYAALPLLPVSRSSSESEQESEDHQKPEVDDLSTGAHVQVSGGSSDLLSALVYIVGILSLLSLTWVLGEGNGSRPARFGMESLLTTGSWRGATGQIWTPSYPDNSYLDQERYHWQPEGCKLRKFEADDILECFKGRRIVVLGDSTSRVIYYGIMHKLNASLTTLAGEKHNSRVLEYGTTRFEFYWDQFLDTGDFDNLMLGSPSQDTPALVVFSFGNWFQDVRSNRSFTEFSQRIDTLHAVAAKVNIADVVVLSKVEVTLDYKNYNAQWQDPARITEMNEYISKVERERDPDSSILILSALNTLIHGLDNEAADGVHFSTKIAEIEADVVLSLACPRLRQRPFVESEAECGVMWQPVVNREIKILIGMVVVGLSLVLLTARAGRSNTIESILAIVLLATTFGSLIIIDSAILFNKVSTGSGGIVVVSAILSAATVIFVHTFWGTLSKKDADDNSVTTFMDRDQTSELKGVLSVIAIFYSLDVTSTSFPPLAFSAFFFLFSYSHMTYFLATGDQTWKRLMRVLIRLNSLALVLAFLMDLNYSDYFFAPLASIWISVQLTILPVLSSFKFTLVCVLIAFAFKPSSTHGRLTSLITRFDYIFSTSWRQFGLITLIRQHCLSPLLGIILSLSNHCNASHHINMSSLFFFASTAYILSIILFPSPLFAPQFLYTSFTLLYLLVRNSTSAMRRSTLGVLRYIGAASLEISLVAFHLSRSGVDRGLVNFVPVTFCHVDWIVAGMIPIVMGIQLRRAGGVATRIIKDSVAATQQIRWKQVGRRVLSWRS